MDSATSDEGYQDLILPHVSRTFALTIPQLPPGLRSAVTTAYLLCRIADTIEDEPALPADETFVLLQRFAAAVGGTEDAAALSRDVVGSLSDRTLPAEHDLVLNMERVLRMMARLDETQRAAIRRCVETMCHGMHHFQHTASLRGLPRSSDLDSYCYYVAGVVGEMLTELFCAHSPAIARERAGLQELAVSFAQGLQMTNILKDIWEDRSRGACWLPQEVFSRYGIDVAQLSPGNDPRFPEPLRELVAVAHGHLRNALAFTLLIPGEEAGIRRFCLWAIGLAVLTLRKIEHNPQFTSGAQVKVSRRAVLMTRMLTSLAVRNDRILTRLFELAARGLPLAPVSALRRPGRVAVVATLHPHSATGSDSARRGLRPEVGRGERRTDGISAQ